MLSRRGLGAAAVCVTLLCAASLSACDSDSDDGSKPAASQDPGRPLETLAADGLPDDFPRDDVPIVDGTVTSVQHGTKNDPGYAIAVIVDDDEAVALADAVKLLEDAGWKQRSGSVTARAVVLTKDGDQVVVTSAPTSDYALISYAIDTSS